MEKISVIVPCYNEEKVLKIFHTELSKTVKIMKDQEFEIIFVDDGSKDKTLEICKELASIDENVRYISFSRNFGKEAAMYAGFENATGDYVVVMDSDLQDPPSLLPEMFKYVQSGEYDSSATRRVSRKGEPPIRSIFARMFYKLMNKISDADIQDGARDYRLMNRKFVDAILSMKENNRFSKGIFGWVGFKTKWVEYENVERAAGETKWSFWKLFKYSMEGIVSFSTTPLLISAVMGIIFCFIAMILIIVVVAKTIMYGDPVSGWPSLICVVLLIGGIQLFSIGVLGQYLAKTYLEIKDRPIYLVRENNINKEN